MRQDRFIFCRNKLCVKWDYSYSINDNCYRLHLIVTIKSCIICCYWKYIIVCYQTRMIRSCHNQPCTEVNFLRNELILLAKKLIMKRYNRLVLFRVNGQDFFLNVTRMDWCIVLLVFWSRQKYVNFITLLYISDITPRFKCTHQ